MIILCNLLKIVLGIVFLILTLLIFALITHELLSEIETKRKCRKKEYPYLGFCDVTDHYGYTCDVYKGKLGHLIWREDRVEIGTPIAFVKTREEAKRACQILENFNYGGTKHEKDD